MVHRSGLRIQQYIRFLYFASLKNMNTNIPQHSVLLIRNKSDIGTQCTLLNDDDCFAEEKKCDTNSDLLESKRKLHDCLVYPKKAKKVKLDLIQIRPGFTDDRFNETSYYIENGLRKVYPYYFTFTSYTKGRWVGRTLLEVFGKEFRAHTTEEYERHIEKGSLTINNKRVASDYVMKHNDLLANVVHRHEVPVTNDTIDIIHIDEDIVVINKPASIPVHPCGRYRHNTIIFLLAKEYNLKDLKTIHRLDRLTSGILMFGRTQNKARKLEAQIRDREVSKQYICRVEGKFPDSIECEEPIGVISYKIGVCKVSSKGKECRTSFQLVEYSKEMNISIVMCKPYSGRMHQIRVHLQYLGYPITNDPLYNDFIFGPEKGRGGNFGKSDEQLVLDLICAHNSENWLNTNDDIPLFKVNKDDISNSIITESQQLEKTIDQSSKPMSNNVFTQTGIDMPDMKFDEKKVSVDPHCYECKINYKDPEPKDLIMYLHAFKYSGPDWAYETPMPVWADINWKES